jgi:HD-GYP domain-containing protein (c-di-GMP phosphodiesterase class II)
MQNLTLLHSDTFPIGLYAEALLRESITPRVVGTPSDATDTDALRVLLVDRDKGSSTLPIDNRTAIVGIGLIEQPRWLTDESVYLHIPESPSAPVLLSAVKRAYQFLYQKTRADQLEKQLTERTKELQKVSEVGIALATVRDHPALLTMILSQARELARADAGSLYLLDEIEGQGDVLRWKLAQNDSLDVSFQEKVLPITRRSLAGYVAMTGETLTIDDAYNLPPESEYSINRSFDEENGYLTRSLLVLPMTNHAGDIIGVLQLINRKRPGAPARLTAATVPDEVVAFDEETVDIMRALAGQAAVAVENNLLYKSIEHLFEGFVTAAVTAIEQRDPTTSGHSFRVADLTVELAKVVDHLSDGQYRHINFSGDQLREIRYA